MKRILHILLDILSSPLQWLGLVLFLSSTGIFFLFWKGSRLIQIVLFPFVIPAMFYMAWAMRLRRRD